jgi:hypothetical protein
MGERKLPANPFQEIGIASRPLPSLHGSGYTKRFTESTNPTLDFHSRLFGIVTKEFRLARLDPRWTICKLKNGRLITRRD